MKQCLTILNKPIFVTDENMPLVTHNRDDCGDSHKDEYNTLNTSNVEETTFTAPYSTNKQATSTSLTEKREKVKRDKPVALYKQLDVKGDLDFIDHKQFELQKIKLEPRIYGGLATTKRECH